MSRHRWTDEEIEWLRENIASHSWKDIASAFNARFNACLSQASVEHKCLRLGITHGRESEHGFVSGERNDYSLTKDIGSERTDSRGRVLIKVKHEVGKTFNFGGNWVQKNRYVWEQHHGKLTTADMILHLNNDKSDCRIENLYKTNRRINRMLGAFGWFFEDRELTLTAIKCCELMDALNQAERKKPHDRNRNADALAAESGIGKD